MHREAWWRKARIHGLSREVDHIPAWFVLVQGHKLLNQPLTTMPRAKKKLILTQPIKEGLKAIKVQLDHRTVITLSSLKALEFWKTRYPKAEVITQ